MTRLVWQLVGTLLLVGFLIKYWWVIGLVGGSSGGGRGRRGAVGGDPRRGRPAARLGACRRPARDIRRRDHRAAEGNRTAARLTYYSARHPKPPRIAGRFPNVALRS